MWRKKRLIDRITHIFIFLSWFTDPSSSFVVKLKQKRMKSTKRRSPKKQQPSIIGNLTNKTVMRPLTTVKKKRQNIMNPWHHPRQPMMSPLGWNNFVILFNSIWSFFPIDCFITWWRYVQNPDKNKKLRLMCGMQLVW